MIAIPLVLLLVVAPLLASHYGVDTRPDFTRHADR